MCGTLISKMKFKPMPMSNFSYTHTHTCTHTHTFIHTHTALLRFRGVILGGLSQKYRNYIYIQKFMYTTYLSISKKKKKIRLTNGHP